MESRGVLAVRIGEFTDSKKCIVRHNGTVIMDIDMEFLHNGLPIRTLTTAKVISKNTEPILTKKISSTKSLLELLGSPNIASYEWISKQYDHEVQATSVIKPLQGRGRINTNAQVFSPVLDSAKGVVLSTGEYPSYSDINTYHMAACAIDTAVRNAISVGGSLDHLAILDNTCWCSSYDPIRLGQLVDAMRACYDYAVGYSTPFISGKDSMFNDFKGYDEKGNPIVISIPPTLLISAIGVMSDIAKSVTPEFKLAGDLIYVLGETHDELGASEYYKMLAKNDVTKIGTKVPKVDFKKNTRVYKALEKAIKSELIASSLSITSGGLGIALAKASIGGMLGVAINLRNLEGTATSVEAKLFSESQGRILISVAKKNQKAFEKMVKGIPHTFLGTVLTGKKFTIIDGKDKVVDTTTQKLTTAYHNFSNKMA
jgi:phosphoribosylformylglycinamidine synthase